MRITLENGTVYHLEQTGGAAFRLTKVANPAVPPVPFPCAQCGLWHRPAPIGTVLTGTAITVRVGQPLTGDLTAPTANGLGRRRIDCPVGRPPIVAIEPLPKEEEEEP